MAAACRAQTRPEAAPAMSVCPGPQAQLLLSVPETPSPSSGGPPPSAVGGRGPRHGHRPLPPAVHPDAGSREQAASRRPRRLSPRNARTGRVMDISVGQTASRPLLSRLLLDKEAPRSVRFSVSRAGAQAGALACPHLMPGALHTRRDRAVTGHATPPGST